MKPDAFPSPIVSKLTLGNLLHPLIILMSFEFEADISLNLRLSSLALDFMNRETHNRYNAVPARKITTILTLKIASTIPNITRLKNEKRMLRLAEVRNSSILLLSSIL
jgi:hypothetical protein